MKAEKSLLYCNGQYRGIYHAVSLLVQHSEAVVKKSYIFFAKQYMD